MSSTGVFQPSLFDDWTPDDRAERKRPARPAAADATATGDAVGEQPSAVRSSAGGASRPAGGPARQGLAAAGGVVSSAAVGLDPVLVGRLRERARQIAAELASAGPFSREQIGLVRELLGPVPCRHRRPGPAAG